MKRLLLGFTIVLFSTQAALGQQKTAALDAAPASGANGATSTIEMQDQMNAMEEMLQANQEQMVEFRTEIKELKAELDAQLTRGHRNALTAATPVSAAIGPTVAGPSVVATVPEVAKDPVTISGSAGAPLPPEGPNGVPQTGGAGIRRFGQDGRVGHARP
jgi:hypothetical protein